MSKLCALSPSLELLTALVENKNYNIQQIAEATQLSKATLKRVLDGKTHQLRPQNFGKLLAFYCQNFCF